MPKMLGTTAIGCCQLVVKILTSQVFLFRKTQALAGFAKTALAGFQPKSQALFMILCNSVHIKVKIACIWTATFSRLNYRHCSQSVQRQLTISSHNTNPVGLARAWPESPSETGTGTGVWADGQWPHYQPYHLVPYHLSDHTSEEAVKGLTLLGNVGTQSKLPLGFMLQCWQYMSVPLPQGLNCPQAVFQELTKSAASKA